MDFDLLRPEPADIFAAFPSAWLPAQLEYIRHSAALDPTLDGAVAEAPSPSGPRCAHAEAKPTHKRPAMLRLDLLIPQELSMEALGTPFAGACPVTESVSFTQQSNLAFSPAGAPKPQPETAVEPSLASYVSFHTSSIYDDEDGEDEQEELCSLHGLIRLRSITTLLSPHSFATPAASPTRLAAVFATSPCGSSACSVGSACSAFSSPASSSCSPSTSHSSRAPSPSASPPRCPSTTCTPVSCSGSSLPAIFTHGMLEDIEWAHCIDSLGLGEPCELVCDLPSDVPDAPEFPQACSPASASGLGGVCESACSSAACRSLPPLEASQEQLEACDWVMCLDVIGLTGPCESLLDDSMCCSPRAMWAGGVHAAWCGAGVDKGVREAVC